MDVAATRTVNLQLLIARIRQRRPGRLQKDVAADLGLGASFLSQLTRGKKMGDDVARKIEQAQGLPHGWMDHRQDEASQVADSRQEYISHHLRIDPETIAAAIRLVRLSFLNLDLEIDQEENGLPLAAAYEFLLQRKEHEVTADNVVAFRPILAQRLRFHQDDTESTFDRGPGGTDQPHHQRRKAG